MGIETDRPRVWSPGFTHSLLAVFALLATFYLKVPDTWIIPADALQGMVLGYLSHIVADMLTPQAFPYYGRAAGVSACLFWRRAKAINWSDFYAWRCLHGRCGCRSPCRKTTSYAGLRR